ncbi:outer membrane protein assembly factor BamB family protein [Halalkalibacterium ligniniphilum]|uniref:outer membrane protein assembly factor BamB family protein n=1 Tax=Halalkalibacterium ligniniphilum TaxID=1134413 RepID=UPI00035E7E4B|nr:PQQ-binding-like beta-propeller repeat protein [Halalkalibacterium ligniniphilum]
MPKKTFVRIGGSWREVKNVWTRISGVWRQQVVPNGRIGGIWKEFIQYILLFYNLIFTNEIGGTTHVVTCAIHSNNGNLYTGRSNGILERRSPTTGNVLSSTALALNDQAIRMVKFFGNNIYIAGSNGSYAYNASLGYIWRGESGGSGGDMHGIAPTQHFVFRVNSSGDWAKMSRVDGSLLFEVMSFATILDIDANENFVIAGNNNNAILCDHNLNVVWNKAISARSVAIDSTNNVYCYDGNGTLRKYNAAGTLIWNVRPSTAGSIAGLKVSTNGVYIISGISRIDKLNPENGSVIWNHAVSTPNASTARCIDVNQTVSEQSVYVGGTNVITRLDQY